MSDFNIKLDSKAVDELKEAVGGGAGSDNTLIVQVTQGTGEADPAWINDKTPEEIYNACVSGKLVYVYYLGDTGMDSQLVISAFRGEEIEGESNYDFGVTRISEGAPGIEWDNKNQVFIYYEGGE